MVSGPGEKKGNDEQSEETETEQDKDEQLGRYQNRVDEGLTGVMDSEDVE